MGQNVLRHAPATGTDPSVSVIVPARNPGSELRELLAALELQILPRSDFEVVIADDGSTDGSFAGIATPDGHVRVTSGPPLNSYAARNRAVAHSRAPVLAFCDSDCKPEPDWLVRGLEELDGCGVVAGLVTFIVPERPTTWTLIDMDSHLDQERSVRGGNAVTANLFVRRELFDRVGGFDDTIPEHGDYDFVSRCVSVGARLAFSPRAVVHHPTRDRGRPLLRKIWIMNRDYAVRLTRDGRQPRRIRARAWVPLVATFRTRRHFGRSVGLDRHRLGQHGVQPGLRDNLRALPILYVLVPYYASTAQLVGWLRGRRLRKKLRQYGTAS